MSQINFAGGFQAVGEAFIVGSTLLIINLMYLVGTLTKSLFLVYFCLSLSRQMVWQSLLVLVSTNLVYSFGN